ncbi:MAG: asparagine synthetase B family protein [Gemmatimonadaceae bacterium]
MSAIIAIVPADGRVLGNAVIDRILGGMAARGSARTNVWRDGGVVIAVARHDWELGPDFSGSALALHDSDLVVAADASVYYRNDLERKLAAKGIRPTGSTPSHLILAAYRAYGDRCPEFLEGEFSFVVWDKKERRLVAARDSSGTRPLFFAEMGGTLVVASSISAVLEHPSCRTELDLTAIGIDAAGLIFATSDKTAYRGVRRLNAAMTLVRSNEQTWLRRHWEPRLTSSTSSSLEEGAEELRVLLRGAVTERLDSARKTSLWLSGGWDSTAVFATAESVLSVEGKSDRLAPVSMSLPTNDPWCETERTSAAVAHWGAKIQWLDSEKIPLLTAPESTAAMRPEPWSHEYEQMMRALASASRKDGARVALNGHGGDFLFYGSPIFLADLLAGGQLMRLWREWQAMPVRKPRAFFEYAIQPVLPESALRAAKWIRRGRPLAGYVQRPIPFWFNRDFVRASGLSDLAAKAAPENLRGVSRTNREAYWILTQPHFDRVVSTTAGFALEEGVEIRMPLLDRRLIDFAMTRPWWERRSAGEDKHLVRHAMKDLLPPEVLAPRPFKTGSLGGYFARALRRVLPELVHLAEAPLLAEFGIVDAHRFRNAVSVCSRGQYQDDQLAVRLLATLQAELWLRGQVQHEGNDSMQATNGFAGAVA